MAYGTLRNRFCPQWRVFYVAIQTPHSRLVEAAILLYTCRFCLVTFYTVGILKAYDILRQGKSAECSNNCCR